MPGIIGLISGKNEKTLFDSMIESINHYDYEIASVISGGIHLGSVDHSFPGLQPQVDICKDERYMTVFSGELFGFNNESLTDKLSDSQFLLKLFRENGTDVLKQINGHFQAGIYDKIESTFYLISDRFSTRPLYYTLRENRLLFSPEVKALLKDDFAKSINYDAISDLFYFGHLFGYKTLFDHIYLLPEASYLILRNGQCQIHRYWDYPYIEDAYVPERRLKKQTDSYSEELSWLLDKSIDFRLKEKPERMLIPLSGGLDSRWMVARAHELGVKPLSSFTMGSVESEDRKYSTLVAEHLDIEQDFFDIKPEPIWDDGRHYSYVSDAMSMIYGPIQNFQPYRHYKSQKFTVIAPQMCDAIFGSTLFKKRPRILIDKNIWDPQSENILLNMFTLIDTINLSLIFQSEFFEKIRNAYLDVPQNYIEKDKRPIYCYLKLLMNEHGRRGTLGGNIVNNLFFRTRMPSYDNDLVEFAFNLPINLRLNQNLYRYTFSKKYPQLARIPRQGTNLPINVSDFRLNLKQLENKIINRVKKTGMNHLIMRFNRWNRPSYIQYSNWFKEKLKERIITFILDKKTLERGIYREDGLNRVLNEHLSGRADHFRLIWQIINLEYFYRNFID